MCRSICTSHWPIGLLVFYTSITVSTVNSSKWSIIQVRLLLYHPMLMLKTTIWFVATTLQHISAETELKEVSLSFWKAFFSRLLGTQRVHSLAAPRLKSIRGYSNTISHVVPWSHIKCLSNYQHNHIWLLIVCVLVSFQKVPALAGCVGAWFLLPETDLMHLNKHFSVL